MHQVSLSLTWMHGATPTYHPNGRVARPLVEAANALKTDDSVRESTVEFARQASRVRDILWRVADPTRGPRPGSLAGRTD